MIFEEKPRTIRETLRVAVSFLSKKGIDNAQNDALVMLEHALGLDRVRLFLVMDEEIEDNVLVLYERGLLKRAEAYPLQYLIGNQEFMSLTFQVTPDVLIPRPETELLVEKVIQLASEFADPPKIADVCTGSGCIIVSICYYFKKGNFLATDISPKALEIAKSNAEHNGVGRKINFYQADLLIHASLKDCDIMVSNPPYIVSSEIDSLQDEVRLYEPMLALDGGADGLVIYNRLIPQAYRSLKEGGWLCLEIGWQQGQDVADLLKQNGFTSVEVSKDFAGHDRIVIGRKPA